MHKIKKNRVSSEFILLGVTLVWLCLVFLSVTLLQQQYWLGFDFKTKATQRGLLVTKTYYPNNPLKVGDRVLSLHSNERDSVEFEALIMTPDVHNLPIYSQYNQVLNINRALYRILQQPNITVVTTRGEFVLTPKKRPISSLSYEYWLPNFTALIALWIGVGIWSYQRKRLETTILLLGSLLFSTGIMMTIIYSSRNLSIEPSILSTMLSLQYLVLGWFPYILLALLLVYPSRLVNTPSLIFIAVIIPFCFWFNQYFQYVDLPLHSFYFNSFFALFIAILVSIIQWRRAKYRPINKAGLRWFFISIFTAPIIGISFYLLPPAFGQQPVLPLWAAQLLFLALFLGFALGVVRYRLFDIERWWFKIWLWLPRVQLLKKIYY